MERPEDHLTVRETVLLVIDAANGTVEGRTAIQKLSYFAGLSIGADLGHRAHYYGPYSREVEMALENETFAGDLEQTVRTFHSASSGREGRQYSYTLTDQGKELVGEIRESKPGPAERIKPIVRQLGALVPGYQQRPLSLAAKVDLILQQQGGTMMADKVPHVATSLGWEVTDEDVAEAVKILIAIKRVAQADAPASA